MSPVLTLSSAVSRLSFAVLTLSSAVSRLSFPVLTPSSAVSRLSFPVLTLSSAVSRLWFPVLTLSSAVPRLLSPCSDAIGRRVCAVAPQLHLSSPPVARGAEEGRPDSCLASRHDWGRQNTSEPALGAPVTHTWLRLSPRQGGAGDQSPNHLRRRAAAAAVPPTG